MAQSYKSLKEDFVSNLSGGTIGEINTVTAVAPAAYLLWSALQTRQGFFLNESPATALTDFLLHVVCLLLAITLYSSVPLILDLLLVAPAFGIFLLPQALASQKKALKPTPKGPPFQLPRTRLLPYQTGLLLRFGEVA
ncbi:mitochondrial distribution and morphology protein 12 [Physcia stellaris]|nr:mitochondrial distribution and morphology protein 12 [Physcia stellaris]